MKNESAENVYLSMMKKGNPDTVFKYLIVTSKDKDFGLVVNTVGYESVLPFEKYPVKGHPIEYNFSPNRGRTLNEYQIIYFVDGEGYFMPDSLSKIKIEKGNAIILYPRQWHTYKPSAKTGWKEFYIGFEGPIVENIVSNKFISEKNQILQIGFSQTLVDLFKKAIEIAKEDNLFSQQRLAGIGLNIISELIFLSQKDQSKSDRSAEIIEQAKAIMYENYSNDIDLMKVAQRLGASYSWFRKVFKQYTSQSPAHYFQEIKIRKAKELLLESNMPIKEISYELNFSSYEYFISRFKKNTGMTPLEFRRSNTNSLNY